MDASREHIALLLLKKVSGELTDVEAEELEHWKQSNGISGEDLEKLTRVSHLQQAVKKYAADYEEANRRGEGMTFKTPVEAPVRRMNFIKRFWWAAAIIIILGAGAYLYNTNKVDKGATAKTTTTLVNDIMPGGDKAVLTLADGRRIVLDSAANGQIASQGSVKVVKLASGEIRYEWKGEKQSEVMINTMSTPRGGQYQLTLPDGSRVWLNAASSITYPAAFIGVERKVKITGEVYMEVAKDKTKPFTVDIDGRSSIQVLGTSFNINAYKEESVTKTTLVEGSVKVNNNAVLQPGQQAVIAGMMQQPKIVAADIAQTLAWKNGLFDFNGLTVRQAMNQLSRWYDIDVQFEGKEPDFKFMGKLYRSATLSEILNMLQKLNLKYKLEGKTLIVL